MKTSILENIKKLILVVTIVFTFFNTQAQVDAGRSWSVYKADESSSNYSPLNQITIANVSQLQPAWTFTMHDKPAGSKPGTSQCNPIIVDGVLYATSTNQWAYAVEAATGKQVWSFDPLDGKQGGEVNRGLTYWENGNDKRILMSANNFLFALNVKTGKLISTFGENGKTGKRQNG